MTYVDGFVAQRRRRTSRSSSTTQKGDSMFVEAGAIRVVECWGRRRPEGSVTTFGEP